MKGSIRAALAVVVVLAVAAAVAASLFFGRIVKAAVVAAGPKVLGAPVELGLVSVSPLTGSGTLRGLVIGNPPGFKTDHAVKVGSVEVKVKLASLMTDTIVVERVAVRDPELVWEIGSGGDSNLTRLQKNAQESAARLGGGESAPAAKPAPASKPSKSLLVEDFSVTGGRVGLASSLLGGKGLDAPLPAVHLTNLGGKGRSPAQVASQAFGAVTGSAQKAVSNIGSKALDSARTAVGGILSKMIK